MRHFLGNRVVNYSGHGTDLHLLCSRSDSFSETLHEMTMAKIVLTGELHLTHSELIFYWLAVMLVIYIYRVILSRPTINQCAVGC